MEQNEKLENMVRDKVRKDTIFNFQYLPKGTTCTTTGQTGLTGATEIGN